MRLPIGRMAMLVIILGIVVGGSVIGFLYVLVRQPTKPTTQTMITTQTVTSNITSEETTVVVSVVTVVSTETVTSTPSSTTSSSSSSSVTTSSTTISTTSTTTTTTTQTGQADFALSLPSSMLVSVGQANNTQMFVYSENNFSKPVILKVIQVSPNISASLMPNVVTPPRGGSANSTLLVILQPYVTPRVFEIDIEGRSGSISHIVEIQVRVASTTFGMSAVVSDFLSFGCINSTNVAQKLIADLTQVQSLIDSGNINRALHKLKDFDIIVKTQTGVTISSSCAVGNTTFSPEDVLLDDSANLASRIDRAFPLDLSFIANDLSQIWSQYGVAIVQGLVISPFIVIIGGAIFLGLSSRKNKKHEGC